MRPGAVPAGPERTNDVKLSRGGIREIEFIVQLLQVVRGGQFPELRTRATLDALPRLMRAGLMPQDTADALAAAYLFLRQVEHRIQYLDDQQTHVLPTNDDDLDWIARTMGYASSGPLLAELDRHREVVAQEFDALLGGGKPDCKSCGNGNTAWPRHRPASTNSYRACPMACASAWPPGARIRAFGPCATTPGCGCSG